MIGTNTGYNSYGMLSHFILRTVSRTCNFRGLPSLFAVLTESQGLLLGEIVVSYPKTILPRHVLLLNTCLG